MLFGARIPLKTLAILSRSLSTLLESGVQVRRALQVVGKKTVHPATRAVLADVSDQIDAGSDVSSALRSHGRFFPGLFLDMVAMAEDSGALPEVLKHLAEHYENNLQLKREFIQAITWPAIQFVAAVLIIALLIVVLGFVADSTGSDALSGLVFGLSGPGGALIWLTLCFGSVGMLLIGWKSLRRMAEAKRLVDPLLLKVPVLGHCLKSFALSRFSWGYYLTQQTGMPVVKSLQDSLKATDNGAFIGAGDDICRRVLEGDTLTESLAASGLFPAEYMEMVSVAEESGTVPEALHRLSPQFQEDARRSLRTLTRAVSGLVWLIVAGFIVVFIFRVASWYVGQINDALQMTM